MPHVAIALPLSPSAIDLDFTIVVDNPNPVGLRLDWLDFDLAINDTPILTSVRAEQGVHIPAHGVGDVHLRTRVGYENLKTLFRQIADMVQGNRATLHDPRQRLLQDPVRPDAVPGDAVLAVNAERWRPLLARPARRHAPPRTFAIMRTTLRWNPKRGCTPSVAALLYFSEGLPFGIVNDLMPVYLRVHHVELTAIGFLSTVASAWTLKVFWSPLIDAFGTYRRWIATAVLAMAICMAALAAMPERAGPPFWTHHRHLRHRLGDAGPRRRCLHDPRDAAGSRRTGQLDPRGRVSRRRSSSAAADWSRSSGVIGWRGSFAASGDHRGHRARRRAALA